MNDDDSDCSDDDSDCSDEEDKGTSDSDVDNEGDESVEEKDDKEDDSVVDEDESVINDITLQNQLTDHYLDNWNNGGTPFSSNKIKYVTKIWKKKHYLNVGKLIGFFGEHDEGFIDFNKWKQHNITQDIQINYSASNNSKTLIIIDDIMSKMNISNNYKVFRILDNKNSIVMNELDIKKKYAIAIQDPS